MVRFGRRGAVTMARRKNGKVWVYRWTDEHKARRGIVFADVSDFPTKAQARQEAERQQLYETYLRPSQVIRKKRQRSGLPKKPCFVYLIRCGEYCKIGKSNDPVRRLVDLQIATPHECELVFQIQSANSYRLEALAHRTFKNKHHRGEWFKIAGDEVTAVIEFLKSNEVTA
jgi:Meiotically up-regulated gene 113